MKVELKDAKVELEVVGGKATLCVNGQNVSVTRDVGVALIFGDNTRHISQTPTVTPKPGLAKIQVPRRGRSGAQSASARKKLSESLKAYHAKKRKQKTTTRNGKSHLNGQSLHVN